MGGPLALCPIRKHFLHSCHTDIDSLDTRPVHDRAALTATDCHVCSSAQPRVSGAGRAWQKPGPGPGARAQGQAFWWAPDRVLANQQQQLSARARCLRLDIIAGYSYAAIGLLKDNLQTAKKVTESGRVRRRCCAPAAALRPCARCRQGRVRRIAGSSVTPTQSPILQAHRQYSYMRLSCSARDRGLPAAQGQLAAATTPANVPRARARPDSQAPYEQRPEDVFIMAAPPAPAAAPAPPPAAAAPACGAKGAQPAAAKADIASVTQVCALRRLAAG